MCQARVLDYKRKFIEAAARYNELSFKTVIHEDERMTALKNAMICTILAAAGQQRSRMLATLYKDERCQQVCTEELFTIEIYYRYICINFFQLPAFNILEKMFLDRLIKRSELREFESLLMPHHRALMSDGSTILDHNYTITG